MGSDLTTPEPFSQGADSNESKVREHGLGAGGLSQGHALWLGVLFAFTAVLLGFCYSPPTDLVRDTRLCSLLTILAGTLAFLAIERFHKYRSELQILIRGRLDKAEEDKQAKETTDKQVAAVGKSVDAIAKNVDGISKSLATVLKDVEDIQKDVDDIKVVTLNGVAATTMAVPSLEPQKFTPEVPGPIDTPQPTENDKALREAQEAWLKGIPDAAVRAEARKALESAGKK